VSFGTCARICFEAITLARAQGIRAGLFRPVTLWPYPSEHLKRIAEKVKKILVVEMNCGQMVEDVKLAVKKDTHIFFYGRPGGGVPTPEEILKEIKRI
ncbi:MAG: 3-methyl-2-oxobutanoate dehydrogenase subunit beta, partial [Candidatus Omnitrophica bacterium]|nr:3-methyl-2-oxobutanoate dehydrogenase subunit beta [Candidatus Omnitrophota bacterium]